MNGLDKILSCNRKLLGADYQETNSPSDHQGLDCVYFTRLENGQFSLIKDWTDVKSQHTLSY
jgi:branched-chain amino acid transport system substrate-binding protein